MSVVFSKPGFRALMGPWIVLAASVLGAVAIGVGSHYFLEREKRESANYDARVREARVRLEAARRERDSLQQSADVFRTLVERGLLQSEQRLELVELVNTLRAKYQLFTLDYEISPQRALGLAGGRVYPSVEVLASRVRIKARALHEGDVLDFLEALTHSRQGFYPIDRCSMKRIEVAIPDALQPRVEAECSLEWITLKDRRSNRAG